MLPRLFLVILVSVVLAKELEMDAEKYKDPENDFFPKWLIETNKKPDGLDTLIIASRRPRVTGKVRGGTLCLNTDECGRGKCCLRRYRSPRRRCRRFQRAGERCTEEQMMGGYYYGFCPCNRHSVCAYVNGTQICVKIKNKPSPKPVPLPTGAPQSNETQSEAKESQESDEVQTTSRTPPKRRFNLTSGHSPDIPDFFKHRMRSTPLPVPVPGKPPSTPSVGVGPAPPLPTVPNLGAGTQIPGGTPIPALPPGLVLIPAQEQEGLPGSGAIPPLPPPPPGSSETVLPGIEGPPLPPPPLRDGEKTQEPLRRISRSAPPSADAFLQQQLPIPGAENVPPFNFVAFDENQQRIL